MSQQNKGVTLYLYLGLMAVFLLLVSPDLFTHGMFLDGIIYATVAKNFAAGGIHPFALYYTDSLFPVFDQHPPMHMWLQSVFFYIFGNGWWVEHLYSFITAIGMGILLRFSWRKMEPDYKNLAWFPILLWILIPIIAWSYSNNMIENTSSVFVLASVVLAFVALESNATYKLFLAGVILCLAFFTKGIVTLFPLVFPLVYILLKEKKFNKSIYTSLVYLMGFLVPFLILMMCSHTALLFVADYMNDQVLNSIQNVQTTQSRWFIVGDFFLKIIPLLVLLGLVFWINRKDTLSKKWNKKQLPLIGALFITGLCGVLPIMISLKQRAFYTVPVYAFIALALSIFLVPQLTSISQFLNSHANGVKKICIALLGLAVIINVAMYFGTGRDLELQREVVEITAAAPGQTTLQLDSLTWSNWSYSAYFKRLKNVNLEYRKPFNYILLESKNVDGQDTLEILKSFEILSLGKRKEE